MPTADDVTLRWVILGIVVLNAAVSGTCRRKARERTGPLERRSEPGRIKLARSLVGLPLFTGLVAYLVRPDWMAWAAVALPSEVRCLGVLMALSSIPFLAWVLRSIGSNISETVFTKEAHELVHAGPYSWVRHPLYSGGVWLLAGVSLAAANWFLAAGTVVMVIVWDRVIIPAEERELIAKFGEAYRSYMSATGRWLPRGRPPG